MVAVRRRAAEHLRQVTGLGVDVVLMAPRTIPRSEGKAVRVVERT
jgi:phenylacetate-coenzyme A ligase PaaK-like adenylate-forming protein